MLRIFYKNHNEWWGGLLFIIIYLWYHGTYCFPFRRNDQTEHVFYWLRSMGFVHCLEITTRWRYYKVLTLFSFVPLTSPDILYVFTVFSTCHQKAASSFSSATFTQWLSVFQCMLVFWDSHCACSEWVVEPQYQGTGTAYTPNPLSWPGLSCQS